MVGGLHSWKSPEAAVVCHQPPQMCQEQETSLAHLRMRQPLQQSQAPSCSTRLLDTGRSLWGCQDCVFCCLNYTSSEEDISRYINFVISVFITLNQKVYTYIHIQKKYIHIYVKHIYIKKYHKTW